MSSLFSTDFWYNLLHLRGHEAPGVRGKPLQGLAMFSQFEQVTHGVTPQTEALYARGFGEFTTFESGGVFGVNRTNWTQAFTTASKSERRVMIKERQTANMLASLGNEALLAPAMKNLAGGPADLLLNGAATEIKTPRSFTYRILERQFAAKQSDAFVIRLDKPIEEWDRAVSKLRFRLQDYPTKRVWVLHALNHYHDWRRYDHDR